MVPLMRPTSLSSDKCLEMLACANGNSETISPQIQLVWRARNSSIAKRAGCPSALKIPAMSNVWLEYVSVFVSPICALLIYRNITIKRKAKKHNHKKITIKWSCIYLKEPASRKPLCQSCAFWIAGITCSGVSTIVYKYLRSSVINCSSTACCIIWWKALK